MIRIFFYHDTKKMSILLICNNIYNLVNIRNFQYIFLLALTSFKSYMIMQLFKNALHGIITNMITQQKYAVPGWQLRFIGFLVRRPGNNLTRNTSRFC